MPEGLVPYASDRPASGRHHRPSSDELPGRLPRQPLDTAGLGGPRENSLRHAHWELPLQSNAIWPKERRFHLLKDDDKRSEERRVGKECRP